MNAAYLVSLCIYIIYVCTHSHTQFNNTRWKSPFCSCWLQVNIFGDEWQITALLAMNETIQSLLQVFSVWSQKVIKLVDKFPYILQQEITEQNLSLRCQTRVKRRCCSEDKLHIFHFWLKKNDKKETQSKTKPKLPHHTHTVLKHERQVGAIPHNLSALMISFLGELTFCHTDDQNQKHTYKYPTHHDLSVSFHSWKPHFIKFCLLTGKDSSLSTSTSDTGSYC